MDFTHVADSTISALFMKDQSTIIAFPLSIRHNTRSIREFLRDGIQRNNKSLVKKRESDSAIMILTCMHNPSRLGSPHAWVGISVSSSHACMGLTKEFVFKSRGHAKDEQYDNDILRGYDWLCRNAIRNDSAELSKETNPNSEFLIQQKGFVPLDENGRRKGFFILKCNNRRGDISIDHYNHFSFHIENCLYEPDNDGILCNRCQIKAKVFRRKCTT